MLVLHELASKSRTKQSLVGHRLGFRVVSAYGERFCRGLDKPGRGGAPATFVPCPTGALAVSGGRCDNCAGKDPSRFMHMIHRGGHVPKDLERHLMSTHWLYVATFGNGIHKIGTAADSTKWSRLAEQGALCARYVARADDGKVVRVLEDAVTNDLGLRQSVRASMKAVTLALPSSPIRLAEANADEARRVSDYLSVYPDRTGWERCDESWIGAEHRTDLTTTDQRLEYPADLGRGDHGFTVTSVVGKVLFGSVDGRPDKSEPEEVRYVIDGTKLEGLRVELGDFDSTLPPVQTALF